MEDNKQQEEVSFSLETKRKSLVSVIDLIRKNYNVDFIIEQVTFDALRSVFYLKKRKEINFIVKKHFVYDYEMNSLERRISFRSLADIEFYLRQQFSESEGFITESQDVN